MQYQQYYADWRYSYTLDTIMNKHFLSDFLNFNGRIL